MAKRRGLFNFNLISPKTKQERVIEIERDNSAVYSMLLVFSAVLVYFVLFLVNAFGVENRLNQNLTAIAQREAATQTFARFKAANGELFIKTESLKLVLTKKVDAERIFAVGDLIVSDVTGARVIEYGRQSTGGFIYTITASNFADAELFRANLEEATDVKNFFLKEVQFVSTENKVRIVITVDINA